MNSFIVFAFSACSFPPSYTKDLPPALSCTVEKVYRAGKAAVDAFATSA